MSFRADLHCHTTCSDGSMSPEDIVALAHNIGLQGLSITDHDTIAAYSSAIPAAKKVGVDLITGVEFTTDYHGETVHILGYSFAVDNPLILDLCSRRAEWRRTRCKAILTKLSHAGMPLDEGFVESYGGIVGRPHIAMAMVEKGYVGSVTEAFKKYLGDGKPCYVQGKALSTEETIKVIHNANGFAVIAHPHLIKNSSTVLKLLEMDFDGIEAYYAKFLPNKEERWVKIGNRKGWIITGGSDFHGACKPTIHLGASWVGPEVFEVLKQRYQQNSHE